jgi:hypothetical protein
MAEPGWGYRFLEAGEQTQEGDECRDFDYETWRPVDEGWSVHPGEGHLYRRPEPQLAYTTPTEAVYYAYTFRIPDLLPIGVDRVAVTQCEHDPSLWRITHQFGGTYEMDSSMRVVRR